MSVDLEHFHFNPIKLGQILRQFCDQYGISKATISKKTGISRDTITNIFSGDTQEVSFEKLFKICCVLGVPMVVIEKLMVKDEDIDFADKIVMYDTASGDILPATEVSLDKMPVPDTVIAAAEAVAAADNPPDLVRTSAETPENVAQLHKHITKLMDLLELALTQKG